MLARRLVLMLLVLACSCAPTRNFEVLFTSSTKVPNKVTDPVRKDARLAALWVGHATTLVQMDDRFILTDPVFTETVGVISRRLVEPGLELERLPIIDAVLISHMHFDHLSQSTLQRLAPRTRTITVPEGGLVYLPDVDVSATALAPFQAWEKDGLRVTAAPVRHNGWRYGADAAWRHVGFTGYIVEYHGLTLYFGGDTGYCRSCFLETADRFPHIDLAILPIAPISPRSFMAHNHEDPRGALLAFQDLGARFFLPIHFDTFINSNDKPGEAAAELVKVRDELGIAEAVAPVLPIGGQRVFITRDP